MEELKSFNTKNEIHIKLCLTLAKHGFEFLRTNDLESVSGFCQECGHGIRYEQLFKDTKLGNEYIIGSDCMFKIYILSYWRNQIKEKDLENKDLQRAGKWLWIIHRDGYLSRIEGDLPQPKDYDNDFKQLADDLKVLVIKIRVKIKKEIAEEKRIAIDKKRQKEQDEYMNKQAQNIKDWFDSQGIDVNKCNDWERNFLDTMYQAYNKGWSLSDKQIDIFNRIKRKKSNQQGIKTNQNLGSVVVIDKQSEYSNSSQLNDWEREFMVSIGKLVDSGYVLTKKQLETLDKIERKLSNDKLTKDYSCFVGQKISTWFINSLIGNLDEGIVESVKKETNSAILCDVLVGNTLEKNLIEDIWVPKSQLIDDGFIL